MKPGHEEEEWKKNRSIGEEHKCSESHNFDHLLPVPWIKREDRVAVLLHLDLS